ncbi:hypothetical protein, partial [Marinobacter sp.]|uniref:hypothetical protein n=1 Tax=Marinobacter sp. TaxID=50741 RepID=UPI003A924D52
PVPLPSARPVAVVSVVPMVNPHSVWKAGTALPSESTAPTPNILLGSFIGAHSVIAPADYVI